MPQPTRTITGTYTNPATGLPATGRIVLSPLPRVWTDADGGEILAGGGTFELVAGTLAQPLTVTDAAGVEPATGRYWVYEERLDGLPYRRRVFELPEGDGQPIKVAAIIDADPAQPGYTPVQGPAGPQGLPGVTGATGPAGPVATAWRRRDLPDMSAVESLYSGAAPTIGVAQGSTPSVGYVIHRPAGVALGGGEFTGPFTYLGASNFLIGSGTPDSTYVLPTSRYPNTRGTLASSQTGWSLEVGCDAPALQVRVNYQSGGAYRLWINGRRVTESMQPLGGNTLGSTHLMTIDFGSAAPRTIRIDWHNVPFGGVYVPPTACLWSSGTRTDRLIVSGDSIDSGSAMNVGGGGGTWVSRVALALGSNDVWNQALGGTGYISAGTSPVYATLGDRLAADVVARAPQRLIVWAGYNDNAGSQGAISTAAASLYAAIRTGLPACDVYVLGCWAPTGSPGASIQNTDNTIRLAAAAAGYPFISPLTGAIYSTAGTLVATHGAFITGTGRVGATTGVGNADTCIGSDGIHPTDVGHALLGRRITAAIRELMPA
ncbi:SGNH/GDSL hydrolase family protein [Streptomyces sp. NPDC058612]|uniref:SGNH/GDSL hydrolase family protein n=1 Tax=Streptomyces sp. NPDC058612 TaxID=3346555 RepID=UPI00365E52A3